MTIQFFVKKTLIFIGVPFLLFIFFLVALLYVNVSLFNRYKVDNHVTTAFIGDSHIEVSADDKIIKNSINLSQSSELYIYSYYKIKGLLKSNPSIKKIYLGFSYHNLSSYYYNVVFGKSGKSVSIRYFYILPHLEQLDHLQRNNYQLSAYLKSVVTTGTKNIIAGKHGYSFLGQYENPMVNSTAIPKSMDKRIRFQYYSNGKLDHFSDENIYYLKQIINFCKTNKIDLVLLNTPLHPYYKERIPKTYITKYKAFIAENQLKTVDLENLELPDDCFMPDGDHVSQKGSTIVSNYLDTEIQQ